MNTPITEQELSDKFREFIATFKTSEQFTEDSWKEINPSKKITRETTIGEIQDWVRTFSEQKRKPMQVTIIELV